MAIAARSRTATTVALAVPSAPDDAPADAHGAVSIGRSSRPTGRQCHADARARVPDLGAPVVDQAAPANRPRAPASGDGDRILAIDGAATHSPADVATRTNAGKPSRRSFPHQLPATASEIDVA